MHSILTRALIASLVIGCAILANVDLWAQCCPTAYTYVAGELLVGFQDGTTQATVESVAASVGSVIKRRVHQSLVIYLMRVPIGEENAFITIFEALPVVLYAEANAVGCFDDPPCTCCPCNLICSNLPQSCPDCAGVIPAGTPGQGLPLTVETVPGGEIRLSWGSPCTPSAGDFSVYEGTLGQFSSHAPVACSTGGLMTMTVAPAAGDTYYLVVPRSASLEGSYGTDNRKLQRPPSPSACLPQGIATSCY